MKRIIDLSVPLDSSIPGFHKEKVKSVEKDGWNASELRIYSHAGTHMDAPVHFNVSGLTIDRIPLESCILDCYLVDIKDVKPGSLISSSVLDFLSGLDMQGKGIILRTGWSKYLGNQEIFRNKLPRIDIALAEKIVELGVRLVGVEPPSVADVNNPEEVTCIHTILLKAGVIILEGLINLEKIEKNPVKIIALPLRIKEGDGAPARVVAIYDL
jgi:kynurenine formamidase